MSVSHPQPIINSSRTRAWLGLFLGAAIVLAGACSSDADTAAESRPTVESESRAETTTTVRPQDVPARPSKGCQGGTDAPTTGSDEKLTLSSGGTERWYLRRVPGSYSPTHPSPLVLDLHGYSEGAEVHAQLSELGEVGESAGFMTVTPQGLGTPPHWATTLDSPDVAFVGDLMDATERDLCVDLARVYVTGFSNGAFLSSAVACAYSDRVAAIAPVAGLRTVEGCDLERPVPVITFHGDADEFVTFDGGLGPGAMNLPVPDGSGRTVGDVAREAGSADQIEETAGDMDKSIPEILDWWAEQDGCGTTTESSQITEDVTLVERDCPRGVAVQLYKVEGGGHAWPGSAFSAAIESVVGYTTTNIDANALMWEFFVQHPL